MTIKSMIFETLLQLVKRKSVKDHHNHKPFDIHALRKNVATFNRINLMLEHSRPDISFSDEILAGVPCMLAHAKVPTNTTILFVHGGGYALGLDIQSTGYRYITAELAAGAPANVWAIEYRLAPEHLYPAAIEDAFAAYLALLAKNIASKDIFIVGDSAGGGLALALLMKIRDENQPVPQGCILMSPWTDLAGTGESMSSRASIDTFVTPFFLEEMRALVVSEERMKEPYISPLYGHYDHLPPLLIFVGGREVLYDDSVRVADKAKQAGVEVTLEVSENMTHVYPVFGGIYKEGKDAIDRMCLFIQEHVSVSA